MKITKLDDHITVETESKTRNYQYDGDGEEEARFISLLEAEFAKNPDFEPDEIFVHEHCDQDGGCGLPTLDCYLGYPKRMEDMAQYGDDFMRDLVGHQSN